MHPFLLTIGTVHITSYGVLVASAYLIGILWLKSQIPDMPGMNEDKFWILIYGLFFGAIMGGKLLFMAVEWRQYATGQLSFFGDFRFGFVFFGGLIGAMIMGALVTWRLKLDYLATSDYFGVALPMGHWVGRIGCLMAGCCYGRPTTVPWAVRLGGSPASATPPDLWGVPLHPTQLYEAASDILIFSVLLKFALPKAKKKQLKPGTVFLLYVLLYSIERFINEFYRGDDRGWSYGGLWVSQWVALVCIAGAGATLLVRGVRASARAPKRAAAR